MSRSERLLDLIQILRRHRRPVSGHTLAGEMNVSIRTLYRDIATLQGQGAPIEGEAGLGYVLKPGFMLPPLMFSEEEIEALVLGSRWVAKRSDAQLGAAARNALAKILAVLPSDLRDDADNSALIVAPGQMISMGENELPTIRRAIRAERKVAIDYRDDKGRDTKRTIWPFALAYFDRVRVVAGWCELRRDIRHFRVDRIVALNVSDERYPRRRHALLKEWRDSENMQPGAEILTGR
jgi:predicted DNA-binding transcriptional regulator YafY